MAKWKNKWVITNADLFNSYGFSHDKLRELKNQNVYEKINAVEINGVLNKNVTVKAHSFISNVCTISPELKGATRTGNTIIFYEGYEESEPVVEWREKEEIEEIPIRTIYVDDPNKYEDEEYETIPGKAGTRTVWYEEEYIDGVSTGRKRNKRAVSGANMIPTKIIRGTKKREVWEPKENIIIVEIETQTEYDSNMYEDAEPVIVSNGTKGKIKQTWEQNTVTGEKRNFKEETIIKMLPKKIIKGTKKHIIEWKKEEIQEDIEIEEIVEIDNTKFVEYIEIVSNGSKGLKKITYEKEIKDEVFTGNTRNRKEEIIVEMIPKKTIKGSRKHTDEWIQKENIEYIPIKETVEYSAEMYKDAPPIKTSGKKGIIKTTWQEHFVDGVSTGEKRNEKITKTEMIPSKTIYGLKDRASGLIESRIFKKDAQKYTAVIVTKDNTKIKEDLANVTIEYISQSKLIGNVCNKFISFNLFNASKYNLSDTIVKLYVIVEDGDQTAKEEYFIGDFIINKTAEKDLKRDEVKFEGQDLLYFKNKKYETELEAPYTIKQLLNEISAKEKIKLNYSNISNLDYEIKGKIYYEDSNLIALLKEIAEATASNVYIDKYNTLTFKGISNKADVEITKSDIFELTESDTEINGYNVITASRIDTDQGTTTEDVYYTKLTEAERANKDKVVEYKLLANNIIDRDRKNAIKSIYGALNSIKYIGVDLEMKAAPFIEPFFNVKLGKKNFFVQDYNINLGNGTSNIICNIETKTQTDYKKATQRQKSLKTELFVDKANGKIAGIINDVEVIDKKITDKTSSIEQTANDIKTKLSKIEEKNNNIIEDYTIFKQDIKNFKYEIKTTGSTNILYDSVFFSFANRSTIKESLNTIKNPSNGELKYTGIGGWTGDALTWMGLSYIEPVSITADNSISRHGLRLRNYKIIQYVTLPTNENKLNKTYYSLSLKYKKNEVGDLEIKITSNDGKYKLIKNETYRDATYGAFKEIRIEKIDATEKEIVIGISAKNDAIVEITDLMLNIGETSIPWTQAIGETRSTDVNIGLEGISVKSKNGNETVMRPDEFAGYDKDGNKIFKLNNDITEVEKLKARSEITMPPLRIVPINEGTRQGWAFVTTTKDDRNILY